MGGLRGLGGRCAHLPRVVAEGRAVETAKEEQSGGLRSGANGDGDRDFGGEGRGSSSP